MTNQSNIGWVIENGSGWNNHKTAEALNAMLAESPDTLPAVPLGYGVLVAPISDKPFGLRCALVRVLPRKLSPVVVFKDAAGQPISSNGIINHTSYETLEEAESLLTRAGFVNHRRTDGVVAEIEMHDDGADEAAGEIDQWALDNFGIEVERISSCKSEQQSADYSAYFIKEMKEEIAKL